MAIREFPLKSGHGFADYLLYVDGKAAGVIEAKKEGVTLSSVETQSDKYTKGLPEGLPHWNKPLPFAYQSTGIETRFTNGLDPEPRSRSSFAFHRPETLADWLEDAPSGGVPPLEEQVAGSRFYLAEASADYRTRGNTVLGRLRHMPPLIESGLWPAQIQAIRNLEKSLKENHLRALIQMATGSGKTCTAISFIYRLIKFAGVRRVLFLVDRGNLADQTLKEFQQYLSPYNNFKFSEENIVQRLTGNTLDTTARVCIGTIQRLYSMLKGKDLPEDLEEESADQLGSLFKQPEPIEYNPAIPIETFDLIVTDECHRSIYKLWAQVLEYFDAYRVGLTAMPSKQTFGFFSQNLVMEYNHELAVADGVNVNYDVYRIRTRITEAGSQVEAGYAVQLMERDTRKKRWEQLDDDFSYDPNQLDRDVVAPDQIYTIVREEFGKGNGFALKITYLDLSEVKMINAPAADIEKLRLRVGDILFNEGGDRDKLGRGWVWEGQLADCIHQNHVFRTRLTSTDILPKFISWWGNSFGKVYFQREGKQTTNLASINLTKLSAFPIPLLPIAEQHRIIAEVDRHLSLIRKVETQVDANLLRSEKMRVTLLRKAFTCGPRSNT